MDESEQQLSLPLEEPTPESHPELFIRVETPELILYDGNGQMFEMLTGRMLVSYRKRTPEDGDAEFVTEKPKSRPVHDTIIEGEDYKTFVQNVLNHTPTVLDAKKWIGAGSHESPSRPSRHPGPLDHGTRTYPLNGEEGGWL